MFEPDDIVCKISTKEYEGPRPSTKDVEEWQAYFIEVAKEHVEENNCLPPSMLQFLAPNPDEPNSWIQGTMDLSDFGSSTEESSVAFQEWIPQILREMKAFATLCVRSGIMGQVKVSEGDDEFREINDAAYVRNLPNSSLVLSFLAETDTSHSLRIFEVVEIPEGIAVQGELDWAQNVAGQPALLHARNDSDVLN